MRHRDLIQNITITLLALSALFLFSRTQFFQLGVAAGGGYWQKLTASSGDAAGDTALSDTLSAPVQLAVTGDYGRYGSVSLTSDSEIFTPVKTLLREVLGSARDRSDSSRAAFQAALGRTSVYCDFLSPLPVAYLADLMGLSADSDVSIRALTAAEQDGAVRLYLWDGESRYYQCETAAQPASLAEVLEQFELGVSTFAFEEEAGQRLAPLSLFPDPLSELPELTVSETAVDTETLLTALSFNPHTNSRYQDSSGTEVVVEGDRVVRVSGSGAFTYTSGGEAALTVEAAGLIPTVREAVTGVQALLERLLPAGDARLYLLSCAQNGEQTLMAFGYQIDGVPIRFADGSPAAEISLTGTEVSALSMRPRQYSTTSSLSLLLPLRQAMAIAGQQEGAALSIGYVDTGTYPLSAAWIAD